MPAGSEQELEELHGLLCEHWKKRLKAGDLSAAEVSALAKFLKDNGIEADAGRDENLGAVLEEIDDIIPFPNQR